MGLLIETIVFEWDNPVFENGFDAMNDEISNEIRELFEDADPRIFKGVFQLSNDSRIWDDKVVPKLFCPEVEYYVDHPANLHGLLTHDYALRIMANHLQSGRIVFHTTVEGNPDEYWIVEPGVYRKGTLKVI